MHPRTHVRGSTVQRIPRHAPQVYSTHGIITPSRQRGDERHFSDQLQALAPNRDRQEADRTVRVVCTRPLVRMLHHIGPIHGKSQLPADARTGGIAPYDDSKRQTEAVADLILATAHHLKLVAAQVLNIRHTYV